MTANGKKEGRRRKGSFQIHLRGRQGGGATDTQERMPRIGVREISRGQSQRCTW